MKAEERITDEITNELSRIAWELSKKHLGVTLNKDVDQSKLQFQRLINEADEDSVTTNIFYGIELIGSVKISMNDDFSVVFDVSSKYND